MKINSRVTTEDAKCGMNCRMLSKTTNKHILNLNVDSHMYSRGRNGYSYLGKIYFKPFTPAHTNLSLFMCLPLTSYVICLCKKTKNSIAI